MQVSPKILGALSAVVIAGAVSGASIGQTTIKQRGVEYDHAPSYEQSFEQQASDTSEPLPDHYPLVRQGKTIPVAELRDSGLYSNARFRRTFYDTDFADAALNEAPPEPYEYAAEPEPPVARTIDLAQAQPMARNAVQPLELDAPAETGPAIVQAPAQPTPVTAGNARTVDVNAVLAAR